MADNWCLVVKMPQWFIDILYRNAKSCRNRTNKFNPHIKRHSLQLSINSCVLPLYLQIMRTRNFEFRTSLFVNCFKNLRLRERRNVAKRRRPRREKTKLNQLIGVTELKRLKYAAIERCQPASKNTESLFRNITIFYGHSTTQIGIYNFKLFNYII